MIISDFEIEELLKLVLELKRLVNGFFKDWVG